MPSTTESSFYSCVVYDASAIRVLIATVIASEPSEEYLLCVANFFYMNCSMLSVLTSSWRAFTLSSTEVSECNISSKFS